MRRNVPFDVAFSLPMGEVLVWTVAFGEQDGEEFDWSSMRWREHKPRGR